MKQASFLDTVKTVLWGMIGIRRKADHERAVPITAHAVPSYGPQLAGEYFKKIECFCFTQQTLAPGEVRRFPVTFVVDPKLPKDVHSIALSYTFFEVAGRAKKG